MSQIMETAPPFHPQPQPMPTAFAPIPLPTLRLFNSPTDPKSSRYRLSTKCCANAAESVSILFQPEGVRIQAYPGEPLTAVANRAGIEIVQDCGVGECGTCEVYLFCENQTSAIELVRSCVEPVPHHNVIVDSVGLEVSPT